MSGLDVTVVDYDSGNLRSVARALEKVGACPRVSGDPASLVDAAAVVLPGVGAGDAAMCSLHTRGLVEPLKEYVASGRPFLGVCLGLQLLLERTEEGNASCLGCVPGQVRRLPEGLKVPHMGWNRVEFSGSHPVFQGLGQDSYFYFVHSYYAEPQTDEGVAGVTEYGISFCSAFARGSLVATQFHPEKSGAVGLKIYHNFVQYAAQYASSSRQPTG